MAGIELFFDFLKLTQKMALLGNISASIGVEALNLASIQSPFLLKEDNRNRISEKVGFALTPDLERQTWKAFWDPGWESLRVENF